jgi:hypothetical protein
LKVFNYKIQKQSTDEIRRVYGDDVKVKKFVDDDDSIIEVENEEFRHVVFEGKVNSTSSCGGGNTSISTEDDDNSDSSILVLGCGNSRLGEDILHYFLDLHVYENKPIEKVPKLIQCDISTHVVTSMSKRYHKYVEKDQMSILQDDATQFTLINDKSMDAVVDKGLVDALFCADRGDMMQQVMSSVHRSLKVGKVFMFFSFSKPEYLLKHTTTAKKSPENQLTNHKQTNVKDEKIQTKNKHVNTLVHKDVKWSSMDILELDDIFIYRFVKADDDETPAAAQPTLKHQKQKLKKRRNRN